jgi:phage terminase large subunit
LSPARWKGAYGGRGSGKSHFFAEQVVAKHIGQPGARGVCIREVQKTLRESAKRLIEDKIQSLGVGSMFDVQREQINTPGGGTIIFQGMQDHTAESIKSLEGFDYAWVEEAQTLSDRSLELLRPTIRKEGSELWFSWNPRTKRDPVDALLRGGKLPSSAAVVRANYADNPFFPKVLDEERQFDKDNIPERYGHIWLGEYEPVGLGAYYANEIIAAREQKRITNVPYQSNFTVDTWWDIGVSDDTSIWLVQYAGKEIHLVDFITDHGEAPAYYVDEIRKRVRQNGCSMGEAILPHDAYARQSATGSSYADVLHTLGVDTRRAPNELVMTGINAARQIFGRCWFDEGRCELGLEALGNYRKEWDDDKRTWKGKPLHDWASHPADAFRYGAITKTAPRNKTQPKNLSPKIAIV